MNIVTSGEVHLERGQGRGRLWRRQPQQLDQDSAAVDRALARLNASSPARKSTNSISNSPSPLAIDGQVSRYYMTRGTSLSDQTLLTTVVALDPIARLFDLDEPSLIRIKQAIVEAASHCRRTAISRC